MNIILAFISGGLVFGIIDYIWLAHIAKKFYMDNLAPLVTLKDGSLVINFYGAVAFYILALIATYIFAVKGATSNVNALIMGATLGFFMYAFYDFTNYATLKSWPISLTLVDILWGTFLMSCVSFVMYTVIKM
jgi:uncharacterized membrane protein